MRLIQSQVRSWSMVVSRPSCQRSEIAHVRQFVAYAKLTLDETGFYPPYNGYRYMIALALYSKCITTAEATLVLLDAGYSDEAFGMTRTMVDIFVTLRYIANKDTDERAKRYAEFTAKESEQWAKIATDYFPQTAQPLSDRMKRLAATFPSPHQWSCKTVKEMCSEPDNIETDPASGKPVVHDFAYRVIYRWTSLYVHPTVGSLWNHLVKAGKDRFIVRSRNARDMSHMALFNAASYLVNTMICFYRVMEEPQPSRLGTWAGTLIAHLARRH